MRAKGIAASRPNPSSSLSHAHASLLVKYSRYSLCTSSETLLLTPFFQLLQQDQIGPD